MSILEAARKALEMINQVEIKGESNIAAMCEAISLMKGIVDTLEQFEGDKYDGKDEQG